MITDSLLRHITALESGTYADPALDTPLPSLHTVGRRPAPAEAIELQLLAHRLEAHMRRAMRQDTDLQRFAPAADHLLTLAADGYLNISDIPARLLSRAIAQWRRTPRLPQRIILPLLRHAWSHLHRNSYLALYRRLSVNG